MKSFGFIGCAIVPILAYSCQQNPPIKLIPSMTKKVIKQKISINLKPNQNVIICLILYKKPLKIVFNNSWHILRNFEKSNVFSINYLRENKLKFFGK